MCGVLRASEGASEVGRERTEWPGSRDDGEYLRDKWIRQLCQFEERY
jgi:hypothetical protein